MSQAELPLFPLPVVLFPGTPQPLHIFEPRYRQLLQDCLSGDQRFGLSLVKPNAIDGDLPQPGDVGCSALIQSHHTFPDGRSNILTVGETRYLLKRLVDTAHPYYVGLVEFFADRPTGEQDDQDLAAETKRLFLQLVELRNPPAAQAGYHLELPSQSESFSYIIAAALDIEISTKEELLRLTSTTSRLQHLCALLRTALSETEPNAATQQIAKRNGRAAGTQPSG